MDSVKVLLYYCYSLSSTDIKVLLIQDVKREKKYTVFSTPY